MSSTTAELRKILIVDDHPLVRAGLKAVIDEEKHFQVCGEAAGQSEAIRRLFAELVDLMVIDISLKDGSGLDLLGVVQSLDPRVKMIIISMHDETLFAQRVLRLGAVGFVSKDFATDEIVRAIRHALAGKVYLSERMKDRMLMNASKFAENQEQTPVEQLSNRELEVFEMIGRGLGTREIADKINLSVKTIETYKAHIKRKLDLENGNELLRYAIRWNSEQMEFGPDGSA